MVCLAGGLGASCKGWLVNRGKAPKSIKQLQEQSAKGRERRVVCWEKHNLGGPSLGLEQDHGLCIYLLLAYSTCLLWGQGCICTNKLTGNLNWELPGFNKEATWVSCVWEKYDPILSLRSVVTLGESLGFFGPSSFPDLHVISIDCKLLWQEMHVHCLAC